MESVKIIGTPRPGQILRGVNFSHFTTHLS